MFAPSIQTPEFISQFTKEILHISGKDNVDANALSRIQEAASCIDFQSLAQSQAQDEELQVYLLPDSCLKLTQVPMLGTDVSIFCDTSTDVARPFITKPFRKAAFDSLHQLSHPGINATVKLVTQRYVWPSIKVDCRKWARACIDCQRAKVSRHVSAPIGTFLPPSSRFEHVHIDIVGPLPNSQEFSYCLTCVDRFSRWLEAFPNTNIETANVAKTFISGWIARFGTPFRTPLRLTNNILGTEHFRTTAYHLQANGLMERFHRQFKAAIRCHATDRLAGVLPIAMLGIRSAWREDLEATPADLVYDQVLQLPGEFLVRCKSTENREPSSDFTKELQKHFQQLRPVSGTHHANKQSFVFKDLATSESAWLRVDSQRRLLQQPYQGLYKIIDKKEKTFDLLIKVERVTVSIDRLKPTYTLADKNEPQKQKAPHSAKEQHRKTIPPMVQEEAKEDPEVPNQKRMITRSGRRVRFADRLQEGCL